MAHSTQDDFRRTAWRDSWQGFVQGESKTQERMQYTRASKGWEDFITIPRPEGYQNPYTKRAGWKGLPVRSWDRGWRDVASQWWPWRNINKTPRPHFSPSLCNTVMAEPTWEPESKGILDAVLELNFPRPTAAGEGGRIELEMQTRNTLIESQEHSPQRQRSLPQGPGCPPLKPSENTD